jgi:hypothetical protein
MHYMMKAALASLLLLPALSTASSVYAPFPGTVKFHRNTYGVISALDILTDSCGYWGVSTAVVGSLSWNVIVRTTTNVCYGNGSGSQNEVKHTFANGYTFRQWHFLKSADSYSRTCDRCQIGDAGATGNATSARSHLALDKSGTPNTSWISPSLVEGQFVDGPIGSF